MTLAPLLLAALAAAPLADVEATLARFTAQEPVRARFTLAFENTSGEGKDALQTKAEVSGEVGESPAGLAVSWPLALVDRAREEERRRSADPAAPTPTRDAVAAVSTLDLAGLLDAAGSLRQALQGATVLEDRPEALDGSPARLLVLKLVPGLSTRDRKYVKDADVQMKLWLGEDGVPLAAEATTSVSGRFMLVVSFKSSSRESWRFQPAGDRLVAVRNEEDRGGEGAGEKNRRRTLTTLVLAAGGNGNGATGTP